jgi:hypothetical protein
MATHAVSLEISGLCKLFSTVQEVTLMTWVMRLTMSSKKFKLDSTLKNMSGNIPESRHSFEGLPAVVASVVRQLLRGVLSTACLRR